MHIQIQLDFTSITVVRLNTAKSDKMLTWLSEFQMLLNPDIGRMYSVRQSQTGTATRYVGVGPNFERSSRISPKNESHHEFLLLLCIQLVVSAGHQNPIEEIDGKSKYHILIGT